MVLFNWPLWAGALLAIMVALYCFAGGIRASIWTDAAQSGVMLIAMALLLVVSQRSGYQVALIVLLSAWGKVDGFLIVP